MLAAIARARGLRWRRWPRGQRARGRYRSWWRRGPAPARSTRRWCDAGWPCRCCWLVYTPPLTYRHARGQRRAPSSYRAWPSALPEASDDGRTYSSGCARPALLERRAGARERRRAHDRCACARGLAAARRRRLARHRAAIDADDRDAARIAHDACDDRDPAFPHVARVACRGVVPRGTPLARPDAAAAARASARTAIAWRGRGRRRRAQRATATCSCRAFRAADAIAVVRGEARRAAQRRRACIAGALDVMSGPAAGDRAARPPVGATSDRYPSIPTLEHAVTSQSRVPRPPFGDGDVRRALALRARQARAARRLDDGFMRPTCNLLPPALAGHRELDPCPCGDPQRTTPTSSRRASSSRRPARRARAVRVRTAATAARRGAARYWRARSQDRAVGHASWAPPRCTVALPRRAAGARIRRASWTAGDDPPCWTPHCDELHELASDDPESARRTGPGVDEDVVEGGVVVPYARRLRRRARCRSGIDASQLRALPSRCIGVDSREPVCAEVADAIRRIGLFNIGRPERSKLPAERGELDHHSDRREWMGKLE